MALLDCESIATTYRSLAAIYGLSRPELDEVLDDLTQHAFRHPDFGPGSQGDQVVLDRLRKVAPKPQFDGVCWFHLTRVPPDEEFSAGLVPVIDRLDQLWDMLYRIIPTTFERAEWNRFRDSLQSSTHHYAGLYRLKTSKRGMSGPYGLLFKQIIKKPGHSCAHYLRTPETVEDICICFKDAYGIDLQGEFQRRTQPKVVKFRHAQARPDTLVEAAYLLHLSRRKLNTRGIMPTSFDGNGAAISKADILKIEALADTSKTKVRRA